VSTVVLSRIARLTGLVAGVVVLFVTGPVAVAPAMYAATLPVASVSSNVVSGQSMRQSAPTEPAPVVVCPTLSGGAFPFSASTRFPPPVCGGTFAWGFTVSGSATGQAEWDSPFVGGWFCTAQAWIPDSHSNDPNAQYYLFDGSRYLANDSFVNQNATTNGWTDVSNGTSFHVTDHMRVTLNDHNPFGQGGWYIAAYAVRFFCSKS
jgi:hypothetical protein